MWTKLALANVKRKIEIGLLAAALVSLSAPVWAQAAEDEDELGGEEGESAAAPAEPAEEPAPEAAKAPPPPSPVLAAPPAAPVSPFSLTVKGVITGTMFMQDLPTLSGNGGGAIFGAVSLPVDHWFLGGDIRQTQINFGIRGPEVLGGATPLGVLEFDMLGGNQINTVPAPAASSRQVVTDAMGMPIGSTAATFTASNQGDESVLPRVRLAYVELNWGAGANILRVGQFHNLLLPMIAASGSHIGVPLGYGAGQLGWRAPGITYLHRFMLSETTALTAGLQVNRNSWLDAAPQCGPTGNVMVNCVPQGVSLGEASMLPQVEARVVLSGPPAPSPFPMYAPNAWQVHLVGHWDVKDMSGIGFDAVPPMADSLTTMVVEGGFKLTLGPVLVAANAWYGKNAGGLFGHMVQMQAPGLGDVSGFGAWGQVGVSFTKNIALWGFFGTDIPDEAEAIAARFFFLKNTQLSGMLSYVDGPVALTLEYLRTNTDTAAIAAAMIPANTVAANQIAITAAYFFY